MPYQTPNLNLSLIAPGQSQKHITHNEAIVKLDSIVQLSALSRSQSLILTEMSDGDRFIVPSNDSSGQADLIGQKSRGGVIYHTPKIGWTSWIEDENIHVTWNGDAWQEQNSVVQTSVFNEVTQFGLNTTADLVNRLAIKSDSSLFSFETGSHRLKVNKSDAPETAAIIFQSDYNGYAELGLTGDNDFHIRTSANGRDFVDSLNIDAESGVVSMPHQPVIFGQIGLPVATPERQLFKPQGGMISTMTSADNTALVIPTTGTYIFSACQLVQISSGVYYWFLIINGVTHYIAHHNGSAFNSQQHANHIYYVQNFQAGDIIELTSSSTPLNAWSDTFSHFSLVKIA